MWKKDIYGYRLYKIRISISSSERSYWDFSENGTVNRLWSYRLWDVKGRINSKTTESVKEPTSFIFKGWHLANDTSEPNLSHVLRNKWGLSDALKYFAELLLVFLLVSAGNTANEPFATF